MAPSFQRICLGLNPSPNLQFVSGNARVHTPFIFRGAAESASPLTGDDRLLDYVNMRFGAGDGLASIIFEADVFGRYSGNAADDCAHIPPEAMVPPPCLPSSDPPLVSSGVSSPSLNLAPGDPGYKTRRQRKAGNKRASQRTREGPVPLYKMREGVLRHIFPEEISTPLNGRTIPHSKPGWVGLRSTASHLIAERALEALLDKGYRYIPWDGRYVIHTHNMITSDHGLSVILWR